MSMYFFLFHPARRLIVSNIAIVSLLSFKSPKSQVETPKRDNQTLNKPERMSLTTKEKFKNKRSTREPSQAVIL